MTFQGATDPHKRYLLPTKKNLLYEYYFFTPRGWNMWLSYTGAKEFLFFDNLLKLWSHSLRAPRQDENCFRMSRNESRWKFYLQEFLIIFSYVILFLNLVAIKYIIFMKIISFYIKFSKRKNLLVIQLWRGEKNQLFEIFEKTPLIKFFLLKFLP